MCRLEVMKSLTSSLYLSKQTVFTASEIGLLWQESNRINLKSKINYYCRTGVLISLRRGIYTLSGRSYDRFELANRIFVPSYVSLETVLVAAGAIFQHDETVFSVSYQTREVTVDDQKYSYRRIDPKIVSNPAGIESRQGYSIATPERAFLDSLYLYGQPYFDRLDFLDWDLCRKLLTIYSNKELEKRFGTYAHH